MMTIDRNLTDTSSLSNRALLTSTISLPWLATIWIGPPIGAAFKNIGPLGYRLVYALFGVLVPLLCVPLIGALWWHYRALRCRHLRHHRQRRMSETGVQNDVPVSGRPRRLSVSSAISSKFESDDQFYAAWATEDLATLARQTWHQLDVTGLSLFTASCLLLLLPFSLAATRPESWLDRPSCFCTFSIIGWSA